jgi:hypothetical protein
MTGEEVMTNLEHGPIGIGFTDSDVADLSDHLVDEVVAWGDVNAVATRVNAHLEAGADQVVLGVLNEGAQPGPVEVARRFADRSS